MKAVNPTTGKTVKDYKEMSPAEVEKILSEVHDTFLAWRETNFKERTKLMMNAAKILKNKRNELANLMALEMGKPLAEGVAEAEKCAWVCEYYAENAESFLKDELIKTDATKSYASFQPIGVVLAVMPWNFPLWQVFRFAAPALMAGNVGVLKHASNVPGSALAIEDIFKEAGFPDSTFRTLLIGSKHVSKVIENPVVKAVTLTGSTNAGKAVASKAGEMLKKTVLELGGSDPYIVLEDADIELAATSCVTSRLINGGQSCIAAKRFIVVDSVREKFEKLFVRLMKEKKMGDPLKEGTQVGPQSRHDLRDDLHKQVENSIKKGAKLLLGGEIPNDKGAYYPPTVLTDVKKGMPAYDEELFGPVASIIPVSSEEEAIEVANDTVFGLGAAIFTKDEKRGEKLAKKIQSGSCFVNGFVKSDPRLPFGGIKESGYGRELSSFGIREFVNIKTVWIK